MSRSLTRVIAALNAAGLAISPMQVATDTRAATQAATGTPRHIFPIGPTELLPITTAQTADFSV